MGVGWVDAGNPTSSGVLLGLLGFATQPTIASISAYFSAIPTYVQKYSEQRSSFLRQPAFRNALDNVHPLINQRLNFHGRKLPQVGDASLFVGDRLVFQDLDLTIKALLEQELPDLFGPGAAPPVALDFTAPDSDSMAKLSRPAITCFLYDIRENLELRQGGYSTETNLQTKIATQQRPQPRVDCSYLFNVWPQEADPAPWQTEHRILDELSAALLRYRKIPEAVLQGSLVGQEPPLRATGLRPSLLNNLGAFWQAMGGRPKATLNYRVTISVPTYKPGPAIPIVQKDPVVDLKLLPAQSVNAQSAR